METRRTMLALMASSLMVSRSMAAAKPDFSGEWKLDASKSDFGDAPVPEKFIRKIDHKEPEIKMTSTQGSPQGGEMSTSVRYVTDGSDTMNTVRGLQAKTRAVWLGQDLTINIQLETPAGKITTDEKWTLGSDGKTLNVASHLQTPQRGIDLKLVFVKQ